MNGYFWRACLRNPWKKYWPFALLAMLAIQWKIPEKFPLLRTPDQKWKYLFTKSFASNEPETVFSAGIQCGLKAGLALNTDTLHVRVEYVSSAQADIDMVFDKQEKLLKVHENWLSFSRVHEARRCQISMSHDMQTSDSIFLCDHVIEQLSNSAVHEIIDQVSNVGAGWYFPAKSERKA